MQTMAFVFDIDGVLVRGKEALPGAQETIATLQKKSIPFIFLTNGGGLTEKAHAEKLGSRLNLAIDPRQFVQSHTPFRDLVPHYADKTVLAVGGFGQQIRDVAHAYGFKKVVTTSDMAKAFGHLHPFPEMTQAYHEEHGRRPESPSHSTPLKIDLIAVFSSPRDWCLDLQVITDLLLSRGGVVGTKSPKNGNGSLPNHGYQQDGQPALHFCNPDFEWATQHAQPRFAQGAFREALQGVWAAATGGRHVALHYSICGKPTEQQYLYGEKALQAYCQSLFTSSKGEDGKGAAATGRIKTVYMVGDNPESDIRGANAYSSRYGSEWKSILVESGVYVSGTKPTCMPTHIAKNVKEAVEWALGQERLSN